MFVVVNDVAFSMEVWDWYHNRMDKVTPENHIEIKVFRPWLKEQHRTGQDMIRTYGQLNGWDFFEFFKEIFMLYTDIQETPLSREVTFQQQEKELMALENRLLYWALTEQHEKEDFGPDMRQEYLDSNRMAFNKKFHLEVCYMMKAIREGFNGLKKKLNDVEMEDIDEINEFTAEADFDNEEVDTFIKKVIRQAYGGDFDEFIIAVMERIKFLTMKDNHEKLAKLKAFEIFGREDFEQKIPESETWRMLFNNYFDEVEDIYNLFYTKFIGHCVMYMYLDYLSWDDSQKSGIDYIPIYKQYCDGAREQSSTNIRYFIDKEKIIKRIQKLYKIRIR